MIRCLLAAMLVHWRFAGALVASFWFAGFLARWPNCCALSGWCGSSCFLDLIRSIRVSLYPDRVWLEMVSWIGRWFRRMGRCNDDLALYGYRKLLTMISIDGLHCLV